jgi:multimeric flavodoxin WrbA
MKRVTAFIGTQSKKATYQAVQEFEKNLREYEDIDFEYVFLGDHHLEFCKSCLNCFDKGEELCPLKDDRDILLSKIEHSDGIVLATPTYAFTVSALMKNLLDRFSYFYHRPSFFDKTYTAIVVQGFLGGNKTRKYLESMGRYFGFQVTKGSYLKTLRPMTEPQKKRLSSEMKKTAKQFHDGLMRPAPPPPSFVRLMMFRVARTNIMTLNESFKDYRHFSDMGWFESDYYYDTSLSPFKKAAGRLFDFLGKNLLKMT